MVDMPRPIQSVSTAVSGKIVFPLWVRREHPSYPDFRRELQRSQFLAAPQLAEIQAQRLQAIVAHAYANVPFYRERMDAAGIPPGAVHRGADLVGLPVLTKRDIQDHGANMLAKNVAEADRVRNQTGGSTGSPVQFYVDKRRFGTRLATAYRTDAWAGLHPGDWHAYLWGARMDLMPAPSLWNTLRTHLLYRRIELNTSSIGEADWQHFLAQLRKYRPQVFVAYAQAAVLFANHVRERGITDIKFRSVIATAEVCSAEDRALIESVFGAKVFNRYGCREVSTIAAECEQHAGLHVSAETLLVEVVADDSTPPGMGKIVVTDLLNRSMPLIRYEIGDVGAWADGPPCPCGRGLPRLQSLAGRLTDFLTMRDGRKLSGVALLTWVFAQMDEVRQVQFIQHAPGDLTLRYVRGPAYNAATEQHLRDRLAPYFKDQAQLAFEPVDMIAKEASGKFRFILHAPRPSLVGGRP